MRIKVFLFSLLLPGFLLGAEDKTDPQGAAIQTILQRLAALEDQNRQLLEEVHALRQEIVASRPATQPAPEAAVSASQPPLDERVDVAERRIEEQSQTKVEAAHKFPVTLTGMFLFNAFSNTGPYDAPNYSYLPTGPSASGGTLRQTSIGLQFQGGSLPGGGTVGGNLIMDFFEPASQGWLRIRTGDLSLDWQNRSFSVGQYSPLISPYQPSSFAEVGITPLAGTGNLWLWLPQARYEERLHLSKLSGITGQVAVLETQETYGQPGSEYAGSLDPNRPAIEGRIAFWHKFDDERRLEIGSGFHVSSTHVDGISVPSRVYSIDWLAIPWSRLTLSGTVFRGQNFSNLGGAAPGFAVADGYQAVPIHGGGGWAQASTQLAKRLTLNIFGGIQANRVSNLQYDDIVQNLSYAGNLMYRISPNVIISFEALQARTRQLSEEEQVRNRYDLALAYLF
jgi:hypothetical protein